MPASEPGWSAQHHGIDPADVPLLRPWLRFARALATPLVALRVPPDALTALGVAASVVVPVLAVSGCYAGAVAAVVVSVLLDGLDGAVAVRTGRVSAHGRAVDSGGDRISELAWWVALVTAAGVWWWQALVFGLLGLGMEMWRARSGGYGVLTVWERPSRAVLTVVGLAAAAVGPMAFTGAVTGGVGVVLAAVGAGQLIRHPR